MAIGSHGRGRGGTVGDGRHGRMAAGRRVAVEKLFSLSFLRAALTIDHYVTSKIKLGSTVLKRTTTEHATEKRPEDPIGQELGYFSGLTVVIIRTFCDCL